MSQSFVGQDNLVLILDTGQDLTGATNTRILYRRPDATKGFFTATIDGTNLRYPIASGDINQKGEWRFQAYFEKAGEKFYGDITSYRFWNPVNTIV